MRNTSIGFHLMVERYLDSLFMNYRIGNIPLVLQTAKINTGRLGHVRYFIGSEPHININFEIPFKEEHERESIVSITSRYSKGSNSEITVVNIDLPYREPYLYNFSWHKGKLKDEPDFLMQIAEKSSFPKPIYTNYLRICPVDFQTASLT